MRYLTYQGYWRLGPVEVAGIKRPAAMEHVFIASRALGKWLPRTAIVHHFNGVKSDNANGNLVVCENQAYHYVLHLRQDALDACGRPAYRQCRYCKQWDDPEGMGHDKGSQFHHLKCACDWQAQYRKRNPRTPAMRRAEYARRKSNGPEQQSTQPSSPTVKSRASLSHEEKNDSTRT